MNRDCAKLRSPFAFVFSLIRNSCIVHKSYIFEVVPFVNLTNPEIRDLFIIRRESFPVVELNNDERGDFMNYAEKIRANIEELREEDVKRYLGDIVVNYILRDQPLTAEDEYIKSIQAVMKLAAAEEIRRNASNEIELNVPDLKI